ncbi:MAG: NifU N-terminal domain-containing protein [Acidobacteriota bacterium]|jgi:hypothetical protein|nr:NifU N-terminal domain-containing protein [Acidobacteriota bacterium]
MGKAKSLKGYEFSNLLFLLGLIVVLGAICVVVYVQLTAPADDIEVVEPGISSENTNDNIAVYYLEGFHIAETTRLYRSRLEIPVTDDGLVRSLFELPGVEEVTLQPELIMVKKNGTVEWKDLSGPIRGIVKKHLHPHY